MKAKFSLLGAAEVAAGLFLASPADEAGMALLSGGASGVISLVQLPATAALGTLLTLDGLKRLGVV